MDAGDQEEGERQLHPSSRRLWAEKHQPTRKSTPAEREGSLKLVKQRERRNQGQPNDNGSICKGWVPEDQTTIKPSNAQALDTCKAQIDNPSSIA